MIRALAACAVDFLRHGPAGGPALARYELYAWLHQHRSGRVALWAVWLGLGLTGPLLVPAPINIHHQLATGGQP